MKGYFNLKDRHAMRRLVLQPVSMLLLAAFMLAGCTSNRPYSIDLMPAPDIYTKDGIDPFEGVGSFDGAPYRGILYATDRSPSEKPGAFYRNQRGNILRLGIGRLEVGDENFTWEEARNISLLKNRPHNYPLKIKSVEEIGILDRSASEFTDSASLGLNSEVPRHRFIELINRKLALSRKKDIYIYVHGYKVIFDNPLLVAAELWHFLGYDGVFIAYAWPSTPKTLAYASDLETSAMSAHFLQALIEVLAEQSDARNIHIIGYSAGTRVVIISLYQLALLHHETALTDIRNKLRIGHVILTGSDFDRQLFGAYLATGLLRIPKDLTVYMSQKDQALGMSRLVFKRERLGAMLDEDKMNPRAIAYLEKQSSLRAIDVTAAEGSETGNGHAYFRNSPWVSSDILVTLMYDLPPEKRGLQRPPGSAIWRFPEDYTERLQRTLKESNPQLFK